jgi:hypothetical protein
MTNESTTNKPPVWFWIVSVLALLWNGAGVYQYLQQAYNTDSFKAMCTPEQLEVYANLPSWYTAVFAIAVFGGFLGCLMLLFRKKIAYTITSLANCGNYTNGIPNFFFKNGKYNDGYDCCSIVVASMVC